MQYYLSLGSNLGNREHTIREALHRIEQQLGTVPRCSSFYYSEPWGFQSEHPFCNICCLLETDLQPLEVLHATQSIERALGRTRKSHFQQRSGLTSGNEVVYEDRVIDIDLIRAFDGQKEIVWNDAVLTLPHPLWEQRDFVVVPLKEISSKKSK